MTKVVSLEERRNTIRYEDGDAMKALAWAAGSPGAQELESAIHDLLFKDDQESVERLRQLLGQCVVAYKKLGPG